MRMEELKVSGKQMFMGFEIPVIEGGFGEDKRIVLETHVGQIHDMETREVRKSILRLIEKKRLKENVDYIDLLEGGKEFTTFDLTQFYAKASITQAKNIFILSERGYTKLIKAMDDDKSWEVMDEFVDSYFDMRKEIKILLSEEDKYILKLYHADTKEEMLLIAKQHEQEVVKPLRDSLDRYERFLCEKTKLLKKSELATKLDTNANTLATLFKKLKIYTPKNCQLTESFLEKFPTIKMFDESDESYTDKNTGEWIEKKGWQWTFLGAKNLVDYLIGLGYVTFTENNGFKLNKNNNNNNNKLVTVK